MKVLLPKSAEIGFVGPRNPKINLLKRKFESFEPIRTTFDENPGPEAVKINIEFGEKSTIQFDDFFFNFFLLNIGNLLYITRSSAL